MWTPRDYQVEAIDAGLDALAAGEDSLIVIPTGGGKSGVIGTITKSLVDDFDGLRVVNVTHVAELIDQNYRELIGMWDWAPAGIYSAGLGRKELGARIVFGGIQSIHGKAKQLGQVDVLQVDEAHLIPRNSQTMYGRFIDDVRRYNPDCRLIGFTATDYRTDSGKLTDSSWAKDGSEVPPLFKKIAYEVGIRRLIDDGYLAGLITKQTATTLSVGGVAKRGGDFVPGQLQAAVDRDNITRPIVQEIIEYGQSRRSWLIFCSGVEHANHVAEEIRRQGYTCGTITGDTDSGARARMIEDFKAGRLRALTNAQVLTTGFNAPGVDLLAMIRPTESAGLYVQICGRGTRPLYAPGHDLTTRDGRISAIAAGPKPNCLVLDFAGNIRRHGPIDMVQPRRPGKGGGEAPVKTCPECFSVIHASVMECPDCGHVFERQLSEKITRTAAAAPILSTAEPAWVKVTRRSFHRHEKFGSTPSVRVEYWRGVGQIIAKEWLAVENARAAGLVKSWWKSCGGLEPPPTSVDDALERVGELRPISEVRIEPDGRFWRITGKKFGGEAADDVEKPRPKWGGGDRYTYSADLDDEIPF